MIPDNGRFDVLHRQPPQNVEAEANLIGSIILDTDTYSTVAPMLQPSFFYDPAHGVLYSHIAAMLDNGHRIDPNLRPPLIHGLLRYGETCNVIAATKVGKSWLSLGLAVAVATGSKWLGHECEQGRVLILDNELHQETIVSRLTTVGNAMGCWPDIRDQISVIPLRGTEIDLNGLARVLKDLDVYSLFLADAFYRFIPCGVSENDNAQMMGLYNLIDKYTGQLGAAWVNIHHSTKGSQDQKAVTDVGSGAGSMSRAADTHVILRPHEEDGIAVLEVALRSFAKVEPMCIRWQYPLWHPADANPAMLKRQKNRQQLQWEANDEEDKTKIIAAFVGGKQLTIKDIREATGMRAQRADKLVTQLMSEKRVARMPEQALIGGRWRDVYELLPVRSDSKVR